jgi:hypothetical protein
MSISGNLRTMELSELLQWLSQGKKTGTLFIDKENVQKRIFFNSGKIISCASTDPREYLGHFLVSHGFITEMELAKAIEMQDSTKMLLGKILVTIGAVSREDLHELLVLKTEESLYDMFSWEEGEFRFVDNEGLASGIIPMALEVTGIALNGMRRVDEWDRIRKIIPDARAIPVAIGFLDDPELPSGERGILGLVDDNRTIEEICIQTHSSEFHVCDVLFRQIENGRLKIVRPREPPATAPSAVTPTGAIAVVNADALMEAARGHMQDGKLDRALRHLRAARSLEPENTKVQTQVREAEDHIQQIAEQAGLRLDAVPQLNRSVDELSTMKLSPEEGFILSRINGTYDVRAILKISPMPSLDAQLVFLRLLRAEHILLEDPK